MPTTRRLTADDVLRLQGARPDVHGYELVDGEPVEVTPASLEHGRIAVRIAHRLAGFVDEHGGGIVATEAGFVLSVPGDPERLRGPDVAFVSDGTLEAAGGIPRKGFSRMAPDLAAEIFSPSNLGDARDFQQRIQDYLNGGVRLLWVVYPDARSATVYHPDGTARLLQEGDTLDGEDVLPGFRLPLEELFG